MESMTSTYQKPTRLEEAELYVAGQQAPSGLYRDQETLKEVLLDEAGALPASFDGRVAYYERVLSRDRCVVRSGDQTREDRDREDGDNVQ